MRTDPGLRDAFEDSIDDGPHGGVPVDALLTRGHRALVRRRILAGTGATLAVVAIFGTTAVAVGGSGTQTSRAPGYAQLPSASPANPTKVPSSTKGPVPALRTPSVREAQRAMNLPLVQFDDRGRLVLVPQAQVVRRVDDPYAGRKPGRSVALELEYRHVRYWFALYQEPDQSGSWSSFMGPGDYDGSFTSWVDEQFMADGGGRSPGGSAEWPGIPDLDLVRFVGSTEHLEPVAGVTILRQRAHVAVWESFAGPEDQTAAAKVETADGERYYVLARRIEGSAPQYIAVTEADGGPTLSSFLDFARTRYAENGGGLL